MTLYMISYADENLSYNTEADDPEEAVANFLAAELISPYEDENARAITAVYRLEEVSWYHPVQNENNDGPPSSDYDAILVPRGSVVIGARIRGQIYKDQTKGREPFKDGEIVSTSRVNRKDYCAGLLIAVTTSGTRYRIVTQEKADKIMQGIAE